MCVLSDCFSSLVSMDGPDLPIVPEPVSCVSFFLSYSAIWCVLRINSLVMRVKPLCSTILSILSYILTFPRAPVPLFTAWNWKLSMSFFPFLFSSLISFLIILDRGHTSFTVVVFLCLPYHKSLLCCR